MTSYIGHTNKIEDATSITVTSEATGFEKENAYDWFLYDWWKASATGTIIFDIDLGASVEVQSWGVAGMNWGDGTGPGFLQYSATGAWAGEQLTADNYGTVYADAVIFNILSTPITARYWRIAYTGTGGPYQAAQLFLGDALALPYGPRIGSTSPHDSFEDEILNNMSDGGFNLGRSVYSEGVKFTISQSKVAKSWVDSNWATLYEAIRSHAFFYVEDQENNPTKAAFCWTDGKIKKPSIEANAADPLMSFSIPCRGIIE